MAEKSPEKSRLCTSGSASHSAEDRLGLHMFANVGRHRGQKPGQDRLIVFIVAEPGYASEAVELIRRWGHFAHQFCDDAEAVMQARSTRPDLMLVDLSLLGISPASIFERTGNCPELSGMRLVAIVPQGTSMRKPKLKKWGFADMLLKPVDPLELLSSVVKTRYAQARS